MVPTVIERDILIEAPREVVWRVITEPAQISQWFSDTAEIDLRAGGAGVLVFDDRATNQAVTVALVVQAVEPPHRFAFRWAHPEGTEPHPGNSLLVEFTLEAEGDNTRLRLVESGYREIDWSDEQKSATVEDHHKGWDVHMARLREYATAS